MPDIDIEHLADVRDERWAVALAAFEHLMLPDEVLYQLVTDLVDNDTWVVKDGHVALKGNDA